MEPGRRPHCYGTAAPEEEGRPRRPPSDDVDHDAGDPRPRDEASEGPPEGPQEKKERSGRAGGGRGSDEKSPWNRINDEEEEADETTEVAGPSDWPLHGCSGGRSKHTRQRP